MTQPAATTERLDNVTVQNRFYPEAKFSIAEYHDGDVLVQVTHRPDRFKSVNVRFDYPGQFFGANNTEADFERLQAVYLEACERHGATPQSVESNRKFFFEVKGHDVLWSADGLPQD